MRNKLLDLVRNGVRCPETAKTCQDCQYHSTRHPMHCDEEAALVDLLIANGVVIPVRCEKCFYFIPMDDVRECPLYKDYPIDWAVDMGCDGLCGNWDRWTSVDEFCSGGTEDETE